jgi:hypothetical protein
MVRLRLQLHDDKDRMACIAICTELDTLHDCCRLNALYLNLVVHVLITRRVDVSYDFVLLL